MYAGGLTQVWSYTNVYKALQQQNNKSNNSSGNNIADLNASAQDKDDDVDDSAGENAPSGGAAKHTNSTSKNNSNDNNLLVSLAVLEMPFVSPIFRDNNSLKVFLNTHFLNNVTTITDSCIDLYGQYIIIVYISALTCVYDISKLNTLAALPVPNSYNHSSSHTNNNSNSSNLVTLTVSNIYPCITPVNTKIMDSNHITYTFDAVCLHNNKYLYQTVLRKKIVRIANDREYVEPLEPLVYLVSIEDTSDKVLSCVGTAIITPENNNNNINNNSNSSNNSIKIKNTANYNPIDIYSTPASAVLIVTFQQINTNNNNAITHKTIFYTLCPIYTQYLGVFNTLSVPLQSTAAISPDTYLHGVSVLNKQNKYINNSTDNVVANKTTIANSTVVANNDNNSNNITSYSLVENKTSSTNNSSNGVVDKSTFPVMLSLKVAFNSTTTTVGDNPTDLCYHLFQLHCFDQINNNATTTATTGNNSSRNNKNNNNNSNNNNIIDSGMQSTASYITKLPSSYKDSDLRAVHLAAYGWLKLSKEDYVSAQDTFMLKLYPQSITVCNNNSSNSNYCAIVYGSFVKQTALQSSDVTVADVDTMQQLIKKRNTTTIKAGKLNNSGQIRNTVSILHIVNGQLQHSVFTSFKHAAEWMGASGPVLAGGANAGTDVFGSLSSAVLQPMNSNNISNSGDSNNSKHMTMSIVALSQDGKQLKFIQTFTTTTITTTTATATVTNNGNAFGTDDPFANDPFNSTPISNIKNNGNNNTSNKVTSTDSCEVVTYELGTEINAVYPSPLVAESGTAESEGNYTRTLPSNKLLLVSQSSTIDHISDPQTIYITTHLTHSNIHVVLKSLEQFKKNKNTSNSSNNNSTNKNQMINKLTLQPNERVINVVWQRLPTPLGSRAGDNSEGSDLSDHSRIWLNSNNSTGGVAEPYIAVHTNFRVLLMTSACEIVNSVQFYYPAKMNNNNSTSNSGYKNSIVSVYSGRKGTNSNSNSDINNINKEHNKENTVTSITWLGSALVYTTSNNMIKYLLPISQATLSQYINNTTNNSTNVYNNALLLSLGLNKKQLNSGTLCSLPINLSNSHTNSLRIVAILPDRIFLSYVKRSVKTGYLPVLSFTVRPINPIEPVILGLLTNSINNSNNSSSNINSIRSHKTPKSQAIVTQQNLHSTLLTQNITFNTLYQLILHYFTPKTLTSNKPLAGALPTTQSTRFLVGLLSLFKPYSSLTALVTGLTTNPTELSSSTDFPRLRWIPNGVKFAAALAATEARVAVMELLGSRPDLQEMLVDPETYGGGSLPHPESILSSHLSMVARVLTDKYLEFELAYKIYDIAGDYTAMHELIVLRNKDNTQRNDTEITDMLVTLSNDSNALVPLEKKEDVIKINLDHLNNSRNRLNTLHKHHDSAKLLAINNINDTNANTNNNSNSNNNSSGGKFVNGRYVKPPLVTTNSKNNNTTSTNNGNISSIMNKTEINLSTYETTQRDIIAKRGGGLGPSHSAALVTAFSHANNSGNSNSNSSNSNNSNSNNNNTIYNTLAMDILEDWLGLNITPEFIEADIGTGLDKLMDDKVRSPLSESEQNPSSWIDLLSNSYNNAREMDKLVGYYRFSDIVHYKEESFVCSILNPATRICVTDLSAYNTNSENNTTVSVYGTSLELFSESATAVQISESSSNIDPGEGKHENIKALYDIIYVEPLALTTTIAATNTTNTATTTVGNDGFGSNFTDNFESISNTGSKHAMTMVPMRGLRCRFPRGSQFDIGMYHENNSNTNIHHNNYRNKMTVELSVCYDYSVSNGSDTKMHVLLQRTLDNLLTSDNNSINSISSINCSGNNVWCLFVTSDGSVSLSCDPKLTTKLSATATANPIMNKQIVSTPASTIVLKNPNTTTTDNIEGNNTNMSEEDTRFNVTSTWYHIAFTIDSSRSDCIINIDNNTITTTSSVVTIFINGAKVVEKTITLSEMALSKLEHNVLYVGPDLTNGWRLTELRLWNDIRSESDLESQRENVLPLAVKRKRTGLRVKGTKKLFSTPLKHMTTLPEPCSEVVELGAGLHVAQNNTTGSGNSGGSGAGIASPVSLAAPGGLSLGSGLMKPPMKMPKPPKATVPPSVPNFDSSLGSNFGDNAGPVFNTENPVASMTNNSGTTISDVNDEIPPPPTTAPPPVPLTAKEKRLLAAKAATAAATDKKNSKPAVGFGNVVTAAVNANKAGIDNTNSNSGGNTYSESAFGSFGAFDEPTATNIVPNENTTATAATAATISATADVAALDENVELEQATKPSTATTAETEQSTSHEDREIAAPTLPPTPSSILKGHGHHSRNNSYNSVHSTGGDSSAATDDTSAHKRRVSFNREATEHVHTALHSTASAQDTSVSAYTPGHHTTSEWCSELTTLTSLHCGALSMSELVDSNHQTKLISHPTSLLYCLHSINSDIITSDNSAGGSNTDHNSSVHDLFQHKIEFIGQYNTHNNHTNNTAISVSIRDNTGRVPDSVVISHNTKRTDNKVIVAAAYNKKAIVVYDITESISQSTNNNNNSTTIGDISSDYNKPKVLSEVPITTTPIVFWQFMPNTDLVLLVSKLYGFTWKTTPQTAAGPDGKVVSAKPQKILERVDVKNPDRWEDRVVLDAGVYVNPLNNEGWTMLVTTDKVHHHTDEGQAVSHENNHYVVTLHHAKSMKAVSFGAICGTFRAGQVLLAWLKPSAAAMEKQNTAEGEEGCDKVNGDTDGDAEWVVTTIDLATLLTHMTQRDATTAAAAAAAATATGAAASSKYIAPLDLSTVLLTEVADGIAATATDSTEEAENTDTAIATTGPKLTAKSILHTNHILHNVHAFMHTSGTAHPGSILLGHMYCMVDRVFLLTVRGDLLLLNAAKEMFYGAVHIPHKFISPKDDGHVVSCYCDVYSEPTNPALNVLTNEGHVLRVSLKGAAIVVKNQGL